MAIVSQTDCLGYAAAFLSCIFSGSFGAVIKCQAVQQAKMDPMVLQTYKIAVAFATSWLVLLVGVKFSFSLWGLVSGLFMVPGGTAGYYGIQNAGLSTAQGIWSACKVMVAFAWGLLVFGEPIRSRGGVLCSILLLVSGLVGMAYFSSRDDSHGLSLVDDSSETNRTVSMEKEEEDSLRTTLLDHENSTVSESDIESSLSSSSSSGSLRPQQASITDASDQECIQIANSDDTQSKQRRNRFWRGVGGALIDGCYGGSVLVPMHYAKSEQTKGLSFLISFCIGCSAVMAVAWLLRFLANASQRRSFVASWNSLPSFHLKTAGPYAVLAGFIWSIGNVASILSVAYLGQGVGYSIVQSQLIVAGLWGVLFFKEIREPGRVLRWFLSAVTTIIGILLLSREHVSLETKQ